MEIEKKLFIIPGFEGKESEKPEKRNFGHLKEEINQLIENYSAEKFSTLKKEKTKEIGMPASEIQRKGKEIGILGRKIEITRGEKIKIPEAKMFYYPAESFRDEEWFKGLSGNKKRKIELKIAEDIHLKVKENLYQHYLKFLEKLEPATRDFFEVNKKIQEKMPKEAEEMIQWRIQSLSDEEKNKILEAINDFKQEFGHLPGWPYALESNCASHVDFVGNIFEHYGFKVKPIHTPGHVGLLVEAAGRSHVSDIIAQKLIPLGVYQNYLKKKTEIKKIEGLGYGGSQIYESGVHHNFGNFLKNLGRPDEAEKEYKKAIEIDPDFARGHGGLGDLFYELERFPEAEKEYRKAIEIAPNFAEAHYNLGDLLYNLNQINEAETKVLKAKEIFQEQGKTKYVDMCKELLKNLESEKSKRKQK